MSSYASTSVLSGVSFQPSARDSEPIEIDLSDVKKSYASSFAPSKALASAKVKAKGVAKEARINANAAKAAALAAAAAAREQAAGDKPAPVTKGRSRAGSRGMWQHGKRTHAAVEGIRLLKKGCPGVKYSRKGKPRQTTFKLSEDESRLSWEGRGVGLKGRKVPGRAKEGPCARVAQPVPPACAAARPPHRPRHPLRTRLQYLGLGAGDARRRGGRAARRAVYHIWERAHPGGEQPGRRLDPARRQQDAHPRSALRAACTSVGDGGRGEGRDRVHACAKRTASHLYPPCQPHTRVHTHGLVRVHIPIRIHVDSPRSRAGASLTALILPSRYPHPTLILPSLCPRATLRSPYPRTALALPCAHPTLALPSPDPRPHWTPPVTPPISQGPRPVDRERSTLGVGLDDEETFGLWLSAIRSLLEETRSKPTVSPPRSTM